MIKCNKEKIIVTYKNFMLVSTYFNEKDKRNRINNNIIEQQAANIALNLLGNTFL